ncbi:MAG: EamA family transporter [Alphaproteobacteria bacterium]|nr:EamA family transporter [Alphaproteobacteria bacterium]
MATSPNLNDDHTIMDYVLLVTLAAIWGSSFMMIKVAVDTIPPFTITAGRMVIAALFLYIAARLAGQALPKDRETWIWAFVISIVGNAIPFTLIGWGETKIDSGLAAILMAIMPVTTVFLAHFFTSDEKLSKRRSLGVAVGFAGVVYLIGANALSSLGDALWHQIAVAGGAVCYAISSIINKKLSQSPNRRATAAAIMISSCVVIIPASALIEQPWTLVPSFEAIIAVVALGILSTAIAQLILFRIVKARGAAFLSLNNYMVPLFGLMWGILLLGETPNSTALIGLLLIIGGIALSRKR